MAKRNCLMTSCPTDCKDDCFNCKCGGAEATKDMYVSINNVQRVCSITGGAADTDEGEYIAEVIRNNLENMVIPAADVQPINSLVKVEERVPTVSGDYLCYLSNGIFEVLYFDREIEDDEYNNDYPFGVWNTYPSDDGGECREWIEVLEVTHWQPLPEPPKED